MIAGLLRVAHIHSVDVGAIENTNQINLLPLNLQYFMNWYSVFPITDSLISII